MIGSGNIMEESKMKGGVRLENKLGKMAENALKSIEFKSSPENQMDSGFISGSSILSSSSFCSEEITQPSDAEYSSSLKSSPHHPSTDEVGPSTTAVGSLSEALDSGIDLSERISSLNLSSSGSIHVASTSVSSRTAVSSDGVGGQTTCPPNQGEPRSKLAQLGLSPVHIAILKEIFRKDADGDTQLHVAVIRGFVEVVCHITRLLPHQALLDIPNSTGRTALHLAVSSGNVRLARHLIVCGACPVAKNRHGDTPLHVACRTGDPEMISGLTRQVTVLEVMSARLSYPPNHTPGLLAADLPNYDGQTCIHIAALFSHTQVLQHLTWYGADVNAKEGKCGRTALHYAVEARNKELVRFLVDSCRAALSIMNYTGLTPYQLAVANDAPEIALLLEDLGAKKDPLPLAFEEELDYDDDSLSFEVDEDSPWAVDDLRIGGIPQVPLQYSNPIPVSSHSPLNADPFL